MSANAVQERVDVLAERANEGSLTEQERAEYGVRRLGWSAFGLVDVRIEFADADEDGEA